MGTTGIKHGIHDRVLANRLTEFRTAYIDKSQTKAAKKIGITQTNLSNMENSISPIKSDVIKTLSEVFGMSNEWFFHGIGKAKSATPDKKDLITDIAQMKESVLMLTKDIKILKATQNHLIKIIENLQKEVAELKQDKN